MPRHTTDAIRTRAIETAEQILEPWGGEPRVLLAPTKAVQLAMDVLALDRLLRGGAEPPKDWA